MTVRAHTLGAGTALLATAALVAGCGGGSSRPGVASVAHDNGTGSSAAQSADTPAGSGESLAVRPLGRVSYSSLVKYSECMRAHGVRDFPDPSPGGGLELHGGTGSDLNPSSAAFQSAQTACRSLSPKGRGGARISPQDRAKLLAFSACMRSHGVPNFPDPQFGTGGEVRITGQGNFKPSSPVFGTAQNACRSDLPGGGEPVAATP
jgi:hypothetical protein